MRWRAGLVLGLVAALTAGCGCPTYLVVRASYADRTPYVEDPAALTVTRHRLQGALADLASLPDPRYARATGPAQVTSCSMDSGQLFQPWAGREWRLHGPARLRAGRSPGSTPQGRLTGSSTCPAAGEDNR